MIHTHSKNLGKWTFFLTQHLSSNVFEYWKGVAENVSFIWPLRWGLRSQFPPFRYFPNFSELPKHMLAIEYFIFGRCRRSSAAVTPVKYECGWNNLTCTFARWKILLTEKLTNGALVTPTPVFIMQCVVPLFYIEGLWYQPRVPFQYRDCLSICRIPILKMIRSWNRLIFILGILISVRRNDYIETAPRCSFIYIPLWLGVSVDL